MSTPIRPTAQTDTDGNAPVFLSEAELAQRWRLSTRTVRQLRTDGRLDHVRFGRRVVYPIRFIEVYEAEQLIEAKTVTLPRRRTR